MADIVAQVREIMAAAHNVHVLATVDAEGRPQMRWMGALVEDPETPWTFYLACGKDSRKMQQLAANPRAQLLFSQVSHDLSEWKVATVSGTGEAVDCEHCRKLLWEGVPLMRQYYSGVDDPIMGIIKFKACCAELLCMQDSHEPCRVEL